MPSGVLQPQGGDWIRADAADLDRKLREGDGVVWAGDPRLELRQGVITANRRCQHPVTAAWLNKGDVIARRWEVHRTCEDGKVRIVAHFRLEEFELILSELAAMRVEAPTHEAVETQIDKANAEIEAKYSREIQDNIGLAIDHGARLFHELTEGKNTFRQVGGFRDVSDEVDAAIAKASDSPQPVEAPSSDRPQPVEAV